MKFILFLLVIGIFVYMAFSPKSPFYSRFHTAPSDSQGEVVSDTSSDGSQASLESNAINTLENIKK